MMHMQRMCPVFSQDCALQLRIRIHDGIEAVDVRDRLGKEGAEGLR
jgi:hypothetical protein